MVQSRRDLFKKQLIAQSYSGGGQGIRSASQTPDGWSIAAVEFDKLGRPVKSYNPFYASTPTGAIPQNTKYTEVLNYDALGRTTSVRLQDNTTVSTAFSDTSNTPTGFNKTCVTVTDQAGKQRRQVADSLGRIVRVDEPDASGNLGAVDAPNQPTYYEYDGNDNLSKVTQSDGTVTQERLFKYDSLSRLTHERQVEANATLNDLGVKVTMGGMWTKVLKYDADGHLLEGVDARGVKTSFVYDGLNRVTSVTFTDDTPTVTYTYDQARTGFYNNGALTRVETASGATARPETLSTATEFDYDKMGRVVKHRQAIGTQTYSLEYGYNLAGQLTSEKYPSGRIINVGYDANGRLSQISDASRTYLNNLQYQSNGGALSGMTLGNGVQQSFGYNDRLQMTQIAWSKDSNLIQRYDYAFGQINAQTNQVDATKNNGQLAQIESYNGGTVSNPTKQFTQKFIYDSIGRLEKETEHRGDNGNQVYQQKFSYDRFGNRYLKQAENPANQNPLMPTFIEDNNIDRATNRFASNTNTSYDEAGNVTTDNKYRALKYFYDANGRMYKTSTSNDTNQNYAVFDASGSKVATKVNEAWRFLIYDIGGKLIAEYGGMTATDEGGVKYIHRDLQSSTRCITRASGQVQARLDYQAFGEEIPANIGQRTATGYGTQDSLRQRYGLTERDEATGLDDTWWRKHENRSGRWTSPDPYNGSMNLGNPQSFNRYSYVENEPTNFVDPSGLQLQLRKVCRTIGYRMAFVDGQYDSTWEIIGCNYEFAWVDDVGEGIGGGGSTQTRGCGVNPVTGKPWIMNDRPDPQTGLRQGGLGNIRPGNGGRGGFRERTGAKHDAVDIVAPVGTNILANRSGKVVAAISGYKPANTSKKRDAQAGGLGNVVIIDHGDGIYTMYAHLTDVSVKVGDSVKQGEILGTSGRTGNANNDQQPEEDDHVHFAVFTGPVKKNGFPVSKSQYKNPVIYLNSPCPKKED